MENGQLSSNLHGWVQGPRAPEARLAEGPSPPRHSGDSLPFNDAVVVLEVKGQQLHLLTELFHAVQGRGRRGAVPGARAGARTPPREAHHEASLILTSRPGMRLNPCSSNLSTQHLTPSPAPHPITHTHIPLSPALTGHLGPLGQDWHKLLRGVVRPEPPLFCPEGAGETARQGSGGNHTLVRREDTAHLWGRGGAGDGKKRVTQQPPARTPGAPEHWSRTHEPPPRPGSAAGTAAFARP